MSEQALGIIDDLLNVLKEADKPQSASQQQQQQAAPAQGQAQAQAKKPQAAAAAAASIDGPYLESCDDIKVGATYQVTPEVARLTKCWQDSELGPNDDLQSYCGVIGLAQETEDDDDTVLLRWENLDTVWIPVRAVRNANGAKATLPSGMLTHVMDTVYLGGCTEAKKGTNLKVTLSLDHLLQCWQECELGPNDELEAYLGVVGQVMDIEDDDDTVELRWGNLDTVWIPAKACSETSEKESIPGIANSWLADE